MIKLCPSYRLIIHYRYLYSIITVWNWYLSHTHRIKDHAFFKSIKYRYRYFICDQWSSKSYQNLLKNTQKYTGTAFNRYIKKHRMECDPWTTNTDPGLWIRIHFIRIRIQQFFWMRIRIQIRIQEGKWMRIHADPDPQPCTDSYGSGHNTAFKPKTLLLFATKQAISRHFCV